MEPEPQIGISTAQGFLSFTEPADGKTCTIEYRSSQGGWETIRLPGFFDAIRSIVMQAIADAGAGSGTGGGGGDTGGGTTPSYPYGITPSPSADYVAAMKQALLNDGKNLQGPCGAFEIIRNVAMGLRDTGCGLLYKPGGNQCQERSTDVVAYKDYANGGTRIVDCLGDAGGQNNPSWQEKGPEENRPMDEWRDAAESSPTEGGQQAAAAAARKK